MQDTHVAVGPFRRNEDLSLIQKIKRLRIRFMAWFGIVMLILFTLGAILADVVSPYDPLEQELTDVLKPPSLTPLERSGRTYIMGSDDLGRDVLSRVLHGSRISLGIGFAAVIIGAVSGTAAGLIAGFYSGESGFRKYIDEVIMGLADIQLSMPSILVAIAIIGSLGPGLIKLTLVIALTGWVTYARTMRGQVLSIKETEYVTAARAVGANTQIIMIRHILPNALSSLFVVATLDMARVILLEAGTELPRTRHSAAHRELGTDAAGGQRLPSQRLVAFELPWHSANADCAGSTADWRLAERHTGPRSSRD